MAFIDQTLATASTDYNLQSGVVGALRRKIASEFWEWYQEHKDEAIKSRQLLLWRVTIRVRDLKGIFVQLFGPEQHSS